MKKSFIIGIILIILGFSLLIVNTYLKNKNDIHNVVESKTKEENIPVYLDATYVAGTITSEEGNSYYVIFGNGYQYIVYMNDENAIKLSKYLLDNPDDSKRIYGVTKEFPSKYVSNGIKFANTWLDNNHTHEEDGEDNHVHDITEEQFYEYFGYVYIDNTTRPNIIIDIIIYLIFIIGILFIFYYVNKRYLSN